MRLYARFIKTIFKDEKIDPDWAPSQRSYRSETVSSQESAQTEISMDIAPSWTGPALSPSPEVTSSNPRPRYSRGMLLSVDSHAVTDSANLFDCENQVQK